MAKSKRIKGERSRLRKTQVADDEPDGEYEGELHCAGLNN